MNRFTKKSMAEETRTFFEEMKKPHPIESCVNYGNEPKLARMCADGNAACPSCGEWKSDDGFLVRRCPECGQKIIYDGVTCS